MWRLNWIHPFTDGNGRTSRALSYLVLCVKLGYRLPGSRTIPDQISENKTPYYEALEKADKEFEKGTVDVSAMEELLSAMLATQLMEVHREATGNH
jgi:Fic family protein